MPAQDLINPPAFSDLSIGTTAMNELRPHNTIIKTFQRIGYDLDSDVMEAIYRQAAGVSPMCSVNAYRDALNVYLNAVELNQENEWREYHGI